MGALSGGAISDQGTVGWPLARKHRLGVRAARGGDDGLCHREGRLGQGYATEALEAMVDVARRINVGRIYALCHPEHRASWRVLEKCGFSRDRSWSKQAEFPNLAPGTLQDVVCYEVVLETTGMHAG